MIAHTCHAEGCVLVTPPRMLMCRKHWNMVPRKLRRAILDTYRPGQERDKNPSAAYLFVQRLACAVVAQDERRSDVAEQCRVQARSWLAQAQSSGERVPDGLEVYL